MMRLTKARLTLAVILCLSPTIQAAPPDLTTGGVPGDSVTIHLGPTGLRGWVYHVRANTSESRQIQVKVVDAGSPAAGFLAVDDVILGANGTGGSPVNFSSDARKALADAINDAEARTPATLKLLRWRAGTPATTTTVQLTLRTMGAYSATAPYNCPKSAKILEEGLEYVMNKESVGRYSLGTLSLLAGNNPANPKNAARISRAQSQARALIPSAAVMAQMMSDVRDTSSTWQRGHTLIVLAEAYLVTGDTDLLPAIEAYAVNIAKNQSLFGTVGHIFAEKNPDGSNNGPMGGGYGTVNSTGMPCFLGLQLARECGLSNPEIAPAIERTSRFFASYAGLGAVPYGEHEAYWQGHENNGKSGLAAVSFALEDNREEEQGFFAMMATASASERETGHTGAFFNYLWAPLGAAAGSEAAAASLFSRLRSYYDLARRWDGGFEYDCLGEGTNSGSEYYDFRMSTAMLLTYALPLRQLHLTGRGHDPVRWLSTTEVAGAAAVDGYVATPRTTNQLISDLGSWSPKVQRLAGNEFANRTVNAATITQITNLATDPLGTSRVGACLALGRISDTASATARAATLAGLLTDPENHVRYMAAEGMRYLPQSAKLGQLNTILSAAASTGSPLLPYDEEDPLHFAHGRLAALLFYSGTAYGPKGCIWGSGINGVNRSLLYPAIRAVSANPVGFSRSTLNQTYKYLTPADVDALAGAIVDSVQNRAPADKMFGGGVRQGGIEILLANDIAEGVPLSMIYMVNDTRGSAYDSALGVLEDYAGSCTTVDPDPDVIGFCQDLLSGSNFAAAQAVLSAIAADPAPAPLTPFKSIQSVSAGASAITLPNNSTTLQVASTDLAGGDTVFTWRKVHGIGNVTFSPNGTSASDNTTISFDGMPGRYLFEVTLSDSRGLTEVHGTVPVTLYNTGGTLPPNNPPTATPQTITASPAASVPFTLAGTDPEGYPLVFTITTPPAAGSLSGTPPNLAYTANWNYTGNDSLTFEVMDTEGQTSSAVVNITIDPGMYWDGGASDIATAGNGASGGGDGTWNTALLNWDEGTSPHVPWHNPDSAVAFFGGTSGTVTLTAPVTVGGLRFDNANYTLTGGAITFGAPGGIAVNTFSNHSVTIASDIAGNFGLRKTGPGTLRPTYSGYSFSGNIIVEDGDLIFHSGNNDGVARSLGGGNFSGNISIAAGSSFQFYRNSTSTPQTFSGVISGGGDLRLAYNTTYNLTGPNAYTGKTIFHGEFNGFTTTLNISSFNSVVSGSMETGMETVPTPVSSSSLGAPTTVANGIVDIGRTGMQASAILNYTGLGETTDRVMNLVASSTSTKTVNNLGTGPLTFTEPWIGNNTLNFRVPITTDADMFLTGSLPGNPQYLEKRGNAKLSLEGPCRTWSYVHLYAGTLEIDSEINDGGVYANLAITTGSGNGGTNFIALPAGTPIQVGMTVAHGRLAEGTTILAILDINANPVVAEISSNSDTATRIETGSIGFAGALGIASPAAANLRWRGNATLKYDGPNDSTNRSFTIDNGFTSTWEIIGGTNLTVSGGTTNTTGKITKTGAGTLTLSGARAYTGVTTVSEGTLALVGGSQTSAVTVAGGASLGFTLGAPTTSTSSVNLTNGTVKITGAVDNSSDYLLMTANLGFTGNPPLNPDITGYELELRDGGKQLWLVHVGSAYSTWAATNATTGSPDDDFDGDGVSNAVEFVLGGLASTKDLGKLPALTTSGGNMLFTFVRDRDSVDGSTLVTIEVGGSLVSWPAIFNVGADTGSSTAGVVVTDNLNGTDTVVLTVSQSPDAKKFARLKAVVTP